MPASLPEPNGELRDALLALKDLGERPERRRQAILWEQKHADLVRIIELRWPDFSLRMRRAGWCGNCLRHVGKGIDGHNRHCKFKPIDRMMEVLRPVR